MFSVFERFLSRKGSSKQVSLGIEITPTGVGFAVVADPAKATPSVSSCGFKPCGKGEWGSEIEAFCKEQSLKGVNTYVAFHPEFYNLMLIDAPNVPDEELTEAVKWRVNDLVSGSVEDYVVDAFRLPEDAYRGRMNMLYAAYIQKDAVISMVGVCEELELSLQQIGISELARAHLTLGREELTDLGVAFVHLDEKKGQIDLFENGHLYLSREIDIGYSMLDEGQSEGELSLDNSSRLDSLSLDIQRSLDYYESQLGKSGISRLFVVSAEPLTESTFSNLSEKLPVRVEAFELGSLIDCDQSIQDSVGGCCVAVGIALGGDDVAA